MFPFRLAGTTAPGGGGPTPDYRIGANFRSTLSYPVGTDGPNDVFANIEANPYPYQIINSFGDEMNVGMISEGGYVCRNYNSGWDVRLTGATYIQYNRRGNWLFGLPQAGTYRLRFGVARAVNHSAIISVHDGVDDTAAQYDPPAGTNEITSYDVPLTSGQVANALGEAKADETAWAASYETDYIEFVVPDRGQTTGGLHTGVTLHHTNGIVSSDSTYLCHVQLEQVA